LRLGDTVVNSAGQNTIVENGAKTQANILETIS